jgi:hypothetical protein
VARQRFEELRTILQAPRFVDGPAHDVRTISASMLAHGSGAVRDMRSSRPAAPDGSTHGPATVNDVPVPGRSLPDSVDPGIPVG